MNRIFVSACALNLLLAAPCALTVERDPEQAKAVAEIEKLFGRVEIDEKRPDKPVITVHLGGTCLSNVVDDDLVHLKALPRLQSLELYKTSVTGAGFVHFRGLTELKTLDLSFSRMVDNEGLENLKGLTQLETLILVDNADVTDAGVEAAKVPRRKRCREPLSCFFGRPWGQSALSSLARQASWRASAASFCQTLACDSY